MRILLLQLRNSNNKQRRGGTAQVSLWNHLQLLVGGRQVPARWEMEYFVECVVEKPVERQDRPFKRSRPDFLLWKRVGTLSAPTRAWKHLSLSKRQPVYSASLAPARSTPAASPEAAAKILAQF